jgi:hypothetical protein
MHRYGRHINYSEWVAEPEWWRGSGLARLNEAAPVEMISMLVSGHNE